MFVPSILRPLPREHDRGARPPAWYRTPFRLYSGPVGSSVSEHLARMLDEHGRWHHCVWFRPESRAGPDAIVGGLAVACRRRWSDEEQPSGVSRPSSLPAALDGAPPQATIVVELHGPDVRTARRVVGRLRETTRHHPVPVVVVREGRWRLGVGSSRPPSTADGADLPDRYRDRLQCLAGGRPGVVHDVADAVREGPRDAVLAAIADSGHLTGLLQRVAHALLTDRDPRVRRALEACLATGYWHPCLTTDPMPVAALRPWLVELEDGWGWLRPVWCRALGRAVRTADATDDAGARTVPTGPTTVRPAPGSPTDPTAREPPAPSPAHGAHPLPDGAVSPVVLDARVLGEFEVRVDGQAVQRWSGRRGPSVLRFLLTRRRRACARDVLLEEFWPDVSPPLARNRLQVAVSGLRRSLREVTAAEVVEYGDGEYRIAAGVEVDLDVDRFREATARARAAERANAAHDALAAYGEALQTYRGEFAADSPFESWTMLPRETLRLSYVDTLDRVARLQIDAGRLDDAVTTGQRMLEVDPCREDAHRLLMSCYLRQGRPHQVARQYELCARMLGTQLGVGPELRTQQLYRCVRENRRGPSPSDGAPVTAAPTSARRPAAPTAVPASEAADGAPPRGT